MNEDKLGSRSPGIPVYENSNVVFPQIADSHRKDATMIASSDLGPTKEFASTFESGAYWTERKNMFYYRYIDYILHTVARDAKSLIDVGSGNCPYLEWFDWIDERLSVDIHVPYSSDTVIGRQCDIMTTDFGRKFDVCTCFQVLEHVPDAGSFAKRLLELSDLVVVSVPYKWPENSQQGHVHDPVDETKLEDWTGRVPNYRIVVTEPFNWKKGQRLIAVYHADPSKRYGKADRVKKRP